MAIRNRKCGAILSNSTKNITGITIPCHWDIGTVKKIIKNNDLSKNIIVKEIYGVLAEGGPVGHGRTRESVVQISRKAAIRFRNEIYNLGIGFSYLLNAPFKIASGKSSRELDEYLDWILGEFRPDALSISSLDLMKYIRKRDKDISIHISTIAGVKNGEDLKKFLQIKPARVVPHHDCGKRWSELKEIIAIGNKNSIEVEMLSTESCLFQCPNRDIHYRHLAKKTSDETFHVTCNSTKLLHPREFILAGGIIRPEDMKIFEEMGIKHFKLSGRAKPLTWLHGAANAYQSRGYEGNLIRLLGIDPSLKAEDWIYIENKALDGFLADFPQSKSKEEEISYCESWIQKLYYEGNFRLNDGSKYKVIDGSLTLQNSGTLCRLIMQKEIGRIQ